MIRKRCENCDRILSKYFTLFDPADISKALEIKHHGHSDFHWKSGFFGDYGYLGNNHFCSKSCGYRWAVRRLTKSADAMGKAIADAEQRSVDYDLSALGQKALKILTRRKTGYTINELADILTADGETFHHGGNALQVALERLRNDGKVLLIGANHILKDLAGCTCNENALLGRSGNGHFKECPNYSAFRD